MYRVLFLGMLLAFTALPFHVKAEVKDDAITTNQKTNFYNDVTRLLQQHVVNGQVKYKALQRDKTKLDRLAKQIAQYNLSSATASEKKAFYINAYNVLVLKQVTMHYPIKSVMDVPGFFDKQKFSVAGESLTLNELENKKLRTPFQDARVHFALVCAAKSCPPLLDKAYTPQLVEKQLESQTRQSLQNPDFIKVLSKQKQVLVSELFKWYEADFLAEAPSVATYISQYTSRPLPLQYSIGFYTYDWELNDAGDSL